MSESLDIRYFRFALYKARHRNLSEAIVYAGCALRLNEENEKALRLLGLCLYESGDLDGAVKALEKCPELLESVCSESRRAKEIFLRTHELIKKKELHKADAVMRRLRHKSIRVLTIRGCIKAAAGRHKAAAVLFTHALCKDRGNRKAAEYLMEAISRI